MSPFELFRAGPPPDLQWHLRPFVNWGIETADDGVRQLSDSYDTISIDVLLGEAQKNKYN